MYIHVSGCNNERIYILSLWWSDALFGSVQSHLMTKNSVSCLELRLLHEFCRFFVRQTQPSLSVSIPKSLPKTSASNSSLIHISKHRQFQHSTASSGPTPVHHSGVTPFQHLAQDMGAPLCSMFHIYSTRDSSNAHLKWISNGWVKSAHASQVS